MLTSLPSNSLGLFERECVPFSSEKGQAYAVDHAPLAQSKRVLEAPYTPCLLFLQIIHHGGKSNQQQPKGPCSQEVEDDEP